MNFLKLSLCFVFGLLTSFSVFAGPTCTTDKTNWKDQTEFKKSLTDQGYKIKIFKVTSGNCYEIYGFDKNNKKVEIYFHPQTGVEVKSNPK